MLPDYLETASRQLERVKLLVHQVGLKYIELPAGPFAVGVAVAFGETDYDVLSVGAGGNENQLAITCGVLRDIDQDRQAALDACNSKTRDCPAYPFYLHDASAGWDINVQQLFPVDLLTGEPQFFYNSVRNLPIVTERAREEFATDQSFGGTPYRLNDEDLTRLLIRSSM